ncbi:hypothetical protein AGMMS50229_09940 [Campylobacterota bacterium]|nr:hypothetical protein AGMMS50229_09940 [Campylobacterota bacterium]
MKSRINILLDKSIAAMRSAVDIVNRPKYDYREEIFVILSVNAWELLLKTKLLKDNEGKVNCLYVKDKSNKYKKSRSKNYITYELKHLINLLNSSKITLEHNIIKNIELLIDARDNAIHFYNPTAKIDMLIRGIGLASVKNYTEVVKEWFDIDLDEFGFCIVPISAISLPKEIQAMVGSQAERNFVDFVSKVMQDQKHDTSKSISLIIDVKMSKTSLDSALQFQVVRDSENKISISEEDLTKQFPYEFAELVAHLKERYSNFKRDKIFNTHMKTIKEDRNCCYTRYLNPHKKSSMKQFYNTNVFNHLDKIYTRQL